MEDRAFRWLDVLDDFNREGLGTESDFSLPTERVICSLDRIIEWRGKSPTGVYSLEREQFDQMFADIEKTSAVTLIDVRDSLCLIAACQVYGDFRSIYYDDNHLNEAGAGLVIQGSFADKILP